MSVPYKLWVNCLFDREKSVFFIILTQVDDILFWTTIIYTEEIKAIVLLIFLLFGPYFSSGYNPDKLNCNTIQLVMNFINEGYKNGANHASPYESYGFIFFFGS